jgi:hypothetical protein
MKYAWSKYRQVPSRTTFKDLATGVVWMLVLYVLFVVFFSL